MQNFAVPTRDQVSENNQGLFDNLQKNLGFVPNLYATFGYSNYGLGNYLTFQNAKSSLSKKEREVVNLVVSQVNDCRYCQAAHTAIGKMNGFTDEQILDIRAVNVSFDSKLAALATFTKETTENRGRPAAAAVDAFFAAGYTNENMVDVILVIGDKIISNYLNNITQTPIDFPAAPVLETAHA